MSDCHEAWGIPLPDNILSITMITRVRHEISFPYFQGWFTSIQGGLGLYFSLIGNPIWPPRSHVKKGCRPNHSRTPWDIFTTGWFTSIQGRLGLNFSLFRNTVRMSGSHFEKQHLANNLRMPQDIFTNFLGMIRLYGKYVGIEFQSDRKSNMVVR